MMRESYIFRLTRWAKVHSVKFIKIILNFSKVSENPKFFSAYLKLWQMSRVFRSLSWNNEFREIVDYLQVNNPLAAESRQEITLVILCHPKDIDLLKRCIASAVDCIEDDLVEIVVVSPERIDLRNLSGDIPIQNILDFEIIDVESVDHIKSKFGNNQSSWVLQQVLKIKVALLLGKDFLLILDADTILATPRKFASASKQLLSISYEYHSPYISSYKKFKPSHCEIGVSFVTHHQVWQGKVIEEIWGGAGLNEWLNSVDSNHPNSVSEYHTYGTFLYNEHPDQIFWARWGNQPLSKRNDCSALCQEELLSSYTRPNSLSLHHYS